MPDAEGEIRQTSEGPHDETSSDLSERRKVLPVWRSPKRSGQRTSNDRHAPGDLSDGRRSVQSHHAKREGVNGQQQLIRGEPRKYEGDAEETQNGSAGPKTRRMTVP